MSKKSKSWSRWKSWWTITVTSPELSVFFLSGSVFCWAVWLSLQSLSAVISSQLFTTILYELLWVIVTAEAPGVFWLSSQLLTRWWISSGCSKDPPLPFSSLFLLPSSKFLNRRGLFLKRDSFFLSVKIFLSRKYWLARSASYLDLVPGSLGDWQRGPSLFSLHSTCLKFEVYVKRSQFTLNWRRAEPPSFCLHTILRTKEHHPSSL